MKSLDLKTHDIPDHLPDEAKEICNNLVNEIDKTHKFYKEQIEFIKQQYKIALRQLSPKLINDKNLAALFDEAEVTASSDDDQDDGESKTKAKKTRKKKKPAIPEGLKRTVVIHDLPEDEKKCPNDQSPLKLIGYDTKEVLQYVPARFEVQEHRYPKYACPICEDGVKRAPPEPSLIPRSFVSPELLAQIAISKYCDHLPLYRQEQIFARDNICITRQVMASWMIQLGEALTNLVEYMRRKLILSDVVTADETPVRLLSVDGVRTSKICYMWQIARWGKDPIIIFNYDQSRKSEVADRLLGDFEGYIQVDGYGGYNVLFQGEKCKRIRVGCLAHCLRKFKDFVQTLPKKDRAGSAANAVIKLMNQLYEIEDKCRGLEHNQRYMMRQELGAVALFDELASLVVSEMREVQESSPYYKALAYTSKELPSIRNYLEHGAIELDNNMIENALRPFCLGRKNWLFIASEAGAQASANIYSLLITAKANGIDPLAYLTNLIRELPKASSDEDYESLLPLRHQAAACL
jgi:transposase